MFTRTNQTFPTSCSSWAPKIPLYLSLFLFFSLSTSLPLLSTSLDFPHPVTLSCLLLLLRRVAFVVVGSPLLHLLFAAANSPRKSQKHTVRARSLSVAARKAQRGIYAHRAIYPSSFCWPKTMRERGSNNRRCLSRQQSNPGLWDTCFFAHVHRDGIHTYQTCGRIDTFLIDVPCVYMCATVKSTKNWSGAGYRKSATMERVFLSIWAFRIYTHTHARDRAINRWNILRVYVWRTVGASARVCSCVKGIYSTFRAGKTAASLARAQTHSLADIHTHTDTAYSFPLLSLRLSSLGQRTFPPERPEYQSPVPLFLSTTQPEHIAKLLFVFFSLSPARATCPWRRPNENWLLSPGGCCCWNFSRGTLAVRLPACFAFPGDLGRARRASSLFVYLLLLLVPPPVAPALLHFLYIPALFVRRGWREVYPRGWWWSARGGFARAAARVLRVSYCWRRICQLDFV